MAQSKVRYAVVGLGYIAQAAVLPSFAHARRNSSLHAIVSGSPEKLNEVGDKYRIPVRATYDDYERCLQEVDAVYLCTPNSEHSDYAVRAAKAGKHILCEKPLAVTQGECDRMIRAAKENNVKIMTAYRLHFEPLFLEVLEIVKSGKIGEPRFFSSNFSMHARPGGIRTQRELGGGTLYDLGVYCINTARLMFNAEPIEVFGRSIDGARSNMPEIDEMTSGILRFDGDRLATFTTSFNANGVSDFRVVGRLDHPFRVRGRQRERLLAQDVLAGLRGGDRPIHVHVVGQRDVDRVDVGVRQQRLVRAVRGRDAEFVRDGSGVGRVARGDRDDLGARRSTHPGDHFLGRDVRGRQDPPPQCAGHRAASRIRFLTWPRGCTSLAHTFEKEEHKPDVARSG